MTANRTTALGLLPNFVAARTNRLRSRSSKRIGIGLVLGAVLIGATVYHRYTIYVNNCFAEV